MIYDVNLSFWRGFKNNNSATLGVPTQKEEIFTCSWCSMYFGLNS